MEKRFLLIPKSERAFKIMIQEAVCEALQKAPDPSPPKPKPLSIDELCEKLGKSKSTLYTWIKKGYIPFHRLGGSIFFYHDEVYSAIEKKSKF